MEKDGRRRCVKWWKIFINFFSIALETYHGMLEQFPNLFVKTLVLFIPLWYFFTGRMICSTYEYFLSSSYVYKTCISSAGYHTLFIQFPSSLMPYAPICSELISFLRYVKIKLICFDVYLGTLCFPFITCCFSLAIKLNWHLLKDVLIYLWKG